LTSDFYLPPKIEKLLRLVSLEYQNAPSRAISKIIVNSHVRIEEQHSSDNWNGGTYGHAIHFIVPEIIFVEVINDQEELAEAIRESINKIKNVENEFISAVFFELSDEGVEENWREKSSLFELPKKITVTQDDSTKLWGVGGLKVFLSHKTEYKVATTALKESLKVFGISCFVAHEDIEPTSEWQNEIERALFSMDILVALLTKEFHESNWTDQELGIAVGRQIPVVSVRLGRDPYGFIGKYQAVKGGESLPSDLLKIFFTHKDVRHKVTEAYIQAIELSDSFNTSDKLAIALPFLNNLTEHEISGLIDAYNKNYQVHKAWSFNGEKPGQYGVGLKTTLTKTTEKKFRYEEDQIVEVK